MNCEYRTVASEYLNAKVLKFADKLGRGHRRRRGFPFEVHAVNLSHAFEAPCMIAYLRHTDSAAGLLCTHWKDKLGLGGP